MIKANELRIGNLIWWCHEEDESVKVVDIDILDDFVYHDENPHDSEDRFARFGFRYAPIPLTEEWLIKFGFDKSNKKWSIGLFVLSDDLLFGRQLLYGSTSIIYVHQLQNLYYALTSTELTPKD